MPASACGRCRTRQAAAAHHMTVDRVPAGVADGADEPAPVDAGLGIEHLARRLVPVDLARGVSPKTAWVFSPAGIDLVVAAAPRFHVGLLPLAQLGQLWAAEQILQRSKSIERRFKAKTPPSHIEAMRNLSWCRRSSCAFARPPIQ